MMCRSGTALGSEHKRHGHYGRGILENRARRGAATALDYFADEGMMPPEGRIIPRRISWQKKVGFLEQSQPDRDSGSNKTCGSK